MKEKLNDKSILIVDYISEYVIPIYIRFLKNENLYCTFREEFYAREVMYIYGVLKIDFNEVKTFKEFLSQYILNCQLPTNWGYITYSDDIGIIYRDRPYLFIKELFFVILIYMVDSRLKLDSVNKYWTKLKPQLKLSIINFKKLLESK